MPFLNLNSHILDAWSVLMLFVIPIGGGIPAGVVLARARGLDWPITMGLYLISDVILACAFEPITWCFIEAGKRFRFLGRLNEAFKHSMSRTISRYGISPSPLTLILISFGVDPMTGRTAALAAGHGFIAGWSLAIAGDMIFFTVIMASTLWLNNILGDGTWAAVIVIVVMTVVPVLFRRLQGWRTKSESNIS